MKNRRKIEPKEIPSLLIPRLLVVFTRQLEILVTTLNERTYAIQTRHNSLRSRMQNITLCFLISISAVILKLMLKITSISPRDLGEYLRRRRRSAFIYHTFIHTHNLLHYYKEVEGVEAQMLIFSSSLMPGRVKSSWIVLIWKISACFKFGKTSIL